MRTGVDANHDAVDYDWTQRLVISLNHFFY